MNDSDDFQLDHYISSKGLNCRICGDPLDTKTTKTMLCKKCKSRLWGENQRKKFTDKYGVSNPMYIQEFVNRISETMKKTYGQKCAMDVPEFRKKYEETCLSKFGTSYYVNSKEFVAKSACKSVVNSKFKSFMHEQGIELEEEKERDNKRFDFQVCGTNIYIEIDPTYTHNVAGNHFDKKGQSENFQIIKTLIAEKYGYRCIHVFDWDNWFDIADLLKPTSKIYARNCIVKVIEDNSYNEFIDSNHLQKNCKGTKIALGLYYNDELVQVMTFGKPRYNKNYIWELLRLCTKKGLTVTGGASKLFKYATSVLRLDSIISYCDRSKFTGCVYEQMGMTKLRESDPQEVWSKGSDKITGSFLRQRGYDQIFNTNYGKGTSNEKLMLENGWYPIYDCGQLVFTFGGAIANHRELDYQSTIDYSALLQSIDKSKEKICEYCGEPFVPKSNFQRYCKRPHYMNCPVCGKKYLVTNNENLKRPPVACSYECRAKRTRETSLNKYGVAAPGNNPEAREKAKITMLERYGVEYAMESEELRQRSIQTIKDKYGVENIQQVDEVAQSARKTQHERWITLIHEKFPLKTEADLQTVPKFHIDESQMQVYILKDKVSVAFLKRYGNRINPVFGKIHLSLGLVQDGVLYQTIRFERKDKRIVLADFGTLSNHVNPNYYTKLINAAINTVGIEQFECAIPRNQATKELVESLSVEFVNEGDYQVFWKINNNLVPLNMRDDIDKMLSMYDYITSDWIDNYKYVKNDSRIMKDLLELDNFNS